MEMGPLSRFLCNCRKNQRWNKSGVSLAKPRFLDFDNTHTVLCGTGQSRDSVAKNTAQSDGA